MDSRVGARRRRDVRSGLGLSTGLAVASAEQLRRPWSGYSRAIASRSLMRS